MDELLRKSLINSATLGHGVSFIFNLVRLKFIENNEENLLQVSEKKWELF